MHYVVDDRGSKTPASPLRESGGLAKFSKAVFSCLGSAASPGHHHYSHAPPATVPLSEQASITTQAASSVKVSDWVMEGTDLISITTI